MFSQSQSNITSVLIERVEMFTFEAGVNVAEINCFATILPVKASQAKGLLAWTVFGWIGSSRPLALAIIAKVGIEITDTLGA